MVSGGNKRNSSGRGRPSPSGSATFGEGRMHRSNSGGRFTDRSQHGGSSYPTTPMAVEVRSTFNAREISDALQSRVQAALDRFKAWNDIPEAERRNKKRKYHMSPFPYLQKLFSPTKRAMHGPAPEYH